ncbi:transferrin-binding protein-like solute binding protein [Altericroceibacterium endophyticum]|uniref:Transferrin-binding protein B C-lobe/N-lobe beta-barrel domain-containing protein n=1 Tax=Altericroceibacterium endophyticum TaxID=1808508 RepID=A0A6I4T5B1_9SPHN|nr:transferrin-binding protein-like solute binding protein [Altericroceibacterium endophyticum]MXO66076.1 hypothetical protein [Altericroceibacterium endophyticum]
MILHVPLFKPAFKPAFTAISLVALSCGLAACGDDGVNSAPPPAMGGGGTPSPSPSPSPTPTPGSSDSVAAALGVTSDRAFETATSSFAVRPPSTLYGDQYAEPFGEGTTIDYDAGADSYTYTRSDGLSVTVTPDDIDEDGQLEGEGGIFGSTGGGTAYVVEDGTITHTIAMVPPGDYGDLSFSYMTVSLWNVNDSSDNSNEVEWQVWGLQTETMPTSGTATYSLDGAIGANGFDASAGIVGAAYDFLNGDSTGELSVDFGSGDISTMLHLIGYDHVAEESRDFGEFSGSGEITSGAQYGGTFAAGGEFYGAFFGPEAQETAFSFYIDTSDLDVTGIAMGFKK